MALWDSLTGISNAGVTCVTLTAYSCLWAVMWVAWKSSGNGMMLVHRYVCAVTEFVLSIGK